jgi:ribonuclease PH
MLHCSKIGATQAADTRMLVTATDPQSTRAKLFLAANKLCAAARRHDAMDDFGTQEQCVANSVKGARHMYISRSAW